MKYNTEIKHRKFIIAVILLQLFPVVTNNLFTGNNNGIKFINSSPEYVVNNTIADNDSIGLYFDCSVLLYLLFLQQAKRKIERRNNWLLFTRVFEQW